MRNYIAETYSNEIRKAVLDYLGVSSFEEAEKLSLINSTLTYDVVFDKLDELDSNYKNRKGVEVFLPCAIGERIWYIHKRKIYSSEVLGWEIEADSICPIIIHNNEKTAITKFYFSEPIALQKLKTLGAGEAVYEAVKEEVE